MATVENVLANWTALCGSDADTVISDLVPLLQLIGNTYIAFRMLTPEEKITVQRVPSDKLNFVRDLCNEISAMAEKILSTIRYIPPDPPADPTPPPPSELP